MRHSPSMRLRRTKRTIRHCRGKRRRRNIRRTRHLRRRLSFPCRCACRLSRRYRRSMCPTCRDPCTNRPSGPIVLLPNNLVRRPGTLLATDDGAMTTFVVVAGWVRGGGRTMRPGGRVQIVPSRPPPPPRESRCSRAGGAPGSAQRTARQRRRTDSTTRRHDGTERRRRRRPSSSLSAARRSGR